MASEDESKHHTWHMEKAFRIRGGDRGVLFSSVGSLFVMLGLGGKLTGRRKKMVLSRREEDRSGPAENFRFRKRPHQDGRHRGKKLPPMGLREGGGSPLGNNKKGWQLAQS